MNEMAQHDDEQRTLWNGTAGQAWIDLQATLDALFAPLETTLTDAAAGAGCVLDVGCGTGATTLALAQHLGTEAQCTGVDLSEPMIALARERAALDGIDAEFIAADAQSHAFAPGVFDAVVSRFGVMFFDDPVRAFANLRRAAQADATLCCITWRSAAENPFMTTAERAAAPLLPQMPARRPDGPGQFAFADAAHVRTLLRDSGWHGIELRPLDVPLVLPERELVRYVSRLGPVGLALQQVDERTRTDIVAGVRAAFEPFVHGDEVRFTAACWIVAASA